MITFYFKMALRSFRSNLLVFAGSMGTLILGALCISLLFSYVHNEFTMDNFHKREKDISMIQMCYLSKEWSGSSLDINIHEFPGLLNISEVYKSYPEDIPVMWNGATYLPEILIADTAFFSIFDFRLLTGDERKVLHDPTSILITDHYARLMFGDENPLGKEIRLTGSYFFTYTVRGVIQDPPVNSSITFDFIVPFRNSRDSFLPSIYGGGASFLLTSEGFDQEAFIAQMESRGQKELKRPDYRMRLVPLSDLYFSKGQPENLMPISRFGDKKNVHIIIVIIAGIFIISMLNFSNLQVLAVNAGARSVGIHKINGANSNHLIFGKMTEWGFMVLFAMFCTTLLYYCFLPWFVSVIRVPLNPDPWFIICVNGIILMLLTLSASIYPWVAIHRSKGTIHDRKNMLIAGRIFGRKWLLVFQLALTIVLIISAMIAHKQLQFMLHKELGFNKEDIVRVRFFYKTPPYGFNETTRNKVLTDLRNKEFLSNELAASPLIRAWTGGASPLEFSTRPWKCADQEGDWIDMNTLEGDNGYAGVFGLKVLNGRFFEEQIYDDDYVGLLAQDDYKIVLNEAAVKRLGLKHPVGTYLFSSWEEREFQIIGVVKDFHYEHLSTITQPLIMVYDDFRELDYFIRLQSGRTAEGIELIKQLSKTVNPGQPFRYKMFSDQVDALYQRDRQLGIIYSAFSVVTMFICVIGLYSISLHATLKRVKEIGILKVHGARVGEVLFLLNKDFLICVLIAFVIATPIAWYAMHRWLESFAYKTPLSWWVFALAGLLALGIAMLTVSWQSWKAATRNPVESLRYE